MKSLANDSVITCDEIIDMPETVSIDSLNKKTKCKMDYYILHIIFLVTICLIFLIFIALLLTATTENIN